MFCSFTDVHHEQHMYTISVSVSVWREEKLDRALATAQRFSSLLSVTYDRPPNHVGLHKDVNCIFIIFYCIFKSADLNF